MHNSFKSLDIRSAMEDEALAFVQDTLAIKISEPFYDALKNGVVLCDFSAYLLPILSASFSSQQAVAGGCQGSESHSKGFSVD
jgi:hypothetical protein